VRHLVEAHGGQVRADSAGRTRRQPRGAHAAADSLPGRPECATQRRRCPGG
jgi:hypothetical protein